MIREHTRFPKWTPDVIIPQIDANIYNYYSGLLRLKIKRGPAITALQLLVPRGYYVFACFSGVKIGPIHREVGPAEFIMP